MARAEAVFQVVDPFVVFVGRVPEVYGAGRMVHSDDPILRTHRHSFAPISQRIAEQSQSYTAPKAVVPVTPTIEEVSRG